MLEVLFSDSAAGSLKIAMNRGSLVGGVTGVIATDEKGHSLPPEELARLQREAAEKERRRWAGTVPLAGAPRDILPFPLWLSVGPIDENGIGPLREKTLTQLLSIYPEGQQTAAEILTAARRRLDTLLSRADREPVRFWVDRTPDAACGLRWVLEQLRPLGWEQLDLQVVELPAQCPGEGGGLALHSLGELHPSQWGALAWLARPLPGGEAAALAGQWQVLQARNAPLRAVLNGVLVSADETLYDPYLRQILDELPETFNEAILIGRTLGQFPLGYSDTWLAMRVERWIADGMLTAVTQPEPDAPLYHRMLRKVSS